MSELSDIRLICECADKGCRSNLPPGVRWHDRGNAPPERPRYLVAPGHSIPCGFLVERREGYDILEVPRECEELVRRGERCEELRCTVSDYWHPECLGEGYCMKDPEGILSTSHHPDCPRLNGGGKRTAADPIPELPARLVEAIEGLAARDAGESCDDPMLTVESVLSALYVSWPSIRSEVLVEASVTASMPPALDYLIGQLETTAEQCKGGDGSNNALRKNGRGEGLRIAASMLREKWPAILAQVDLPSAMEAERLRAGCKAMRERLIVALATCPDADLSDFDQGQEQAWSDAADNLVEILGWPKCAECGVFAESGVCPDCGEAAGEPFPARPSDLWARLMEFLEELEMKAKNAADRADIVNVEPDYYEQDRPGSVADINASARRSADLARRLRELLGLPPKDGRS